jgi:hypothetical protein
MAEIGQRWRMIHDRQGRTTPSMESPTWTGIGSLPPAISGGVWGPETDPVALDERPRLGAGGFRVRRPLLGEQTANLTRTARKIPATGLSESLNSDK